MRTLGGLVSEENIARIGVGLDHLAALIVSTRPFVLQDGLDEMSPNKVFKNTI